MRRVKGRKRVRSGWRERERGSEMESKGWKRVGVREEVRNREKKVWGKREGEIDGGSQRDGRG